MKNTKISTNLKKKLYFIFFILLLIIIFIFVILLFFSNAKSNLKSEAALKEFGIVCIGDSLTHGTGGAYISYPDYLREIMKNDYNYVPIYNLGIGGENTLTIAGRMGAIPFQVDSFNIPSSGKVKISFLDKNQSPFRQDGNDGINPCKISDVEGNLSYDSNTDEYYFERFVEGNSITVNKGAVIDTYANSFYRDGIFIIFIGENGGFDTYDELIYQQQSILNLQKKNHDKYIIVGLCTGTYDERKELDELLNKTYGNKYFNIREILTNEEILDEYNIELTDTDKEQISVGRIPDSLRMDDIHFSPDGYYIFADQIYKKLKELNYFAEIDSSISNYRSHWSILDRFIKFLRDSF